MTKKRIEIIAASSIILILIALLIWYFLLRKEQPSTTVIEEEAITEETTTSEEMIEAPQLTPDPVARTFVERFGSYSSESNYTNVEDVMAIATPALQSQLTEIARRAREDVGSSYYGVSTSVISVETIEQTETSARLEVLTQREESFDSPANTSVRYQKILLTMVKTGDNWLVSDFSWE